jgi:hypothetical protein
MSNSGVDRVRLRGSNPNLSSMLPGLNQLAAQCSSLGSFIDEAIGYLAAANMTLLTMEYHGGTRELSLIVRGQ